MYAFRCARDFRPELRRRLKFIAPGLQTRDNNGGLPDDSDSGSVGNNAASSGPQPKKPRQDFWKGSVDFGKKGFGQKGKSVVFFFKVIQSTSLGEAQFLQNFDITQKCMGYFGLKKQVDGFLQITMQQCNLIQIKESLVGSTLNKEP